MPRIFISYRRSDSTTYAEKIYEALVERFGRSAVFLDFEGIELAEDFAQKIVSTLEDSACELVLVVIGSTWLKVLHERAAQDNDWVRRELELAMRTGKAIAPVLIDDAELPRDEQLPASMQGMHLNMNNGARLNASEPLNTELRKLVYKAEQCLFRPTLEQFKVALQSETGYQTEQHQTLAQRVKSHPVDSLAAYRLKCLADWYESTPKDLDQHFVELILLTDRGKDNKGGQFQEASRFNTLQALMQNHQTDDFARVLLGPPGCGKSTLLKHLAYQVCLQYFHPEQQEPQASAPLRALPDFIPFFVELNQYPDNKAAKDDAEPFEWLQQRWATENPHLSPLTKVMQEQPVLLLMDALNEMHTGDHSYQDLVRRWKTALKQLHRRYPHIRILFSCRSLDYSGILSDHEKLPVAQIQFADMSLDKVQEYLAKYLPEQWQTLYEELNTATGLSIEKTPFYLNLAIQQFNALGHSAPGPSALIAGMVWLALERELDQLKPEDLQIDGAVLLSEKDQACITGRLWQQAPHKLPSEGCFIPALIRIAGMMQRSHTQQGQDSKQISLPETQLFEQLVPPQAKPSRWWHPKPKAVDFSLPKEVCQRVLELAQRLDLLAYDLIHKRYKFQHQLMQEYFAAHDVVQAPATLYQRPYKAQAVKPSIATIIDGLALADPLPPPPPSGWEQTLMHRTALSDDADRFITQLMPHDVVLAGRCGVRSEVLPQLQASTIHKLQQALLVRCQDHKTDLRVRIAAGFALGELGDPRFTATMTDTGIRFIRPPLATVPAGTYTIGDNRSAEADEKPQHQVTLAAFELGQYPVTNREWQCFMAADGYEDERWWQSSEASLKWLQGESEQTERIDWCLAMYRAFQQDEQQAIADRPSLTPMTIENFRNYIQQWSEQEFEELIRHEFRPQTYRQPSEWDNPRFNNPSQPVVGICWYEALAYCQWLSEMTGERYLLPSEAQRRAAAQGLQGRTYPWGDKALTQVTNTFESHIRYTTMVGMYELGKTPKHKQQPSLYDLSGNVWEWCLSLYQEYPIQAHDQRDDVKPEGSRISTGGAWTLSLSAARAGYRLNLHPDYRDHDVGFRVLREPPS